MPGLGHNRGPSLGEDRWDAKPRLNQSVACPRVFICDLPAGLIPEQYFTKIELSDERDPVTGELWVQPCCRTIRRQGTIEAWYSSLRQKRRKVPDIYVMTCTECGRLQRRFCVGGALDSGATPEYRPTWTRKGSQVNHG